jgi:UDP-glucose 4-epimerase
MRAIVTGGAGFIGSHVADALIPRGDQVHVVDDLSSGRVEQNVPEGAALHQLDLRGDGLRELATDLRPEVIFHLAAQADVGISVEQPTFDAEVNVVGTIHVRRARLVPGSSSRRPAVRSTASASAPTWNRLYGTRHVACRLANVYGPRQLPALEGGVVAIFLDRLREGRETEIFGDGKQTRDFVYVGDVVQALLAAASTPEVGVFNVGSGTERSILELHRLRAEAAGVEQSPRFAGRRPGDLGRSVLDASRAGRALGWRAETALADGLARTWRSVQTQ